MYKQQVYNLQAQDCYFFLLDILEYKGGYWIGILRDYFGIKMSSGF